MDGLPERTLARAPSEADVARWKALRDARVRALLAGRAGAAGRPGAGAATRDDPRPDHAQQP